VSTKHLTRRLATDQVLTPRDTTERRSTIDACITTQCTGVAPSMLVCFCYVIMFVLGRSAKSPISRARRSVLLSKGANKEAVLISGENCYGTVGPYITAARLQNFSVYYLIYLRSYRTSACLNRRTVQFTLFKIRKDLPST